jgi:large subunit ribosomal protein L4
VIEDPALSTPKTQSVAAMLDKMGLADRKVLVVNGKSDRMLWLSCRNLANARCTHAGELNAYDVMHSEDVVFTRSGLKALEEVLAG